MKSLGGLFCIAFLGLSFFALSSSAHAYRYGSGKLAVNSGSVVQYRHKVRIRYRRRLGRRYGRRIASFVRFGPYATRRSLRRGQKMRRNRRRW